MSSRSPGRSRPSRPLIDEPCTGRSRCARSSWRSLVTVTDALLAFPIAYYMARVASPRDAHALVIAVLVPLWAAYLVKVFAWRTILQGNGLLEWLLEPLGIASPGLKEHCELVARAELPVAAVHDPADLRRARADPGVAARGVGRPRRAGPDDLPAGHPAARLPGPGRGLDLHLLADARRLHHAGPRVRREVHRQRHLRQLEPRQPAARRGLFAAPDRDHDRLPRSSRGASAPSSRCEGDDRVARPSGSLLRIASGGVLVFLYLPLVVVAIYAFNESRIQAWPPTGFSLQVVQRGGREPGRHAGASSTRSSPHARDGHRARPRHARVAGRPSLSRSSDGRRSRSCSSFRSRCRALSPASRCAPRS